MKKEVGKIKKNKRGSALKFFIVLLFLAAIAGSLFYFEFYIRSPLCGIWERSFDESGGSRIDVYRREDSYQAVIVNSEGEMREKGFAAGDMLWRNIKEIDEGNYQGSELIGSHFGFNYENFFLTMSDPNTLEAEPASAGIFQSTPQTWKKKGNNIIANLMRLLGLEDSFPTEKEKKAAAREPKMVFVNDKSWSGWDGLDYAITEEGEITISRIRHLAPNIHYDFRPEEVDNLLGNAIFSLNTQLTGFINNTYTLLTVFTEESNIALVTDKTGRIGIVTGPDGTPDYSDPGVFTQDVHDVSLFFNLRDNQIAALVDNEPVIIVQRFFPFHPIQSVWMGTVWIGGANNFGAPVRHIIKSFEIGYFE